MRPPLSKLAHFVLAPASPEAPVPLARRRASIYSLVVLAVAALACAWSIRRHWDPNHFLIGDGAFYMNVVRGILERGTLDQGQMHPRTWFEMDLGWNRNLDAAWSNIGLGRDGKTWYPKHPLLFPLAALPFIWAYGPLGALAFHAILHALMAFLAFRIAARFAGPEAALAVSLAAVMTAYYSDGAWAFNNDTFYAVLLLAAFDAAFARKEAAAGLFCGFAVFAKLTNIIVAPALALPYLLRRKWRPLLKACAFAAGPIAGISALNWYMFGAPWTTGYNRTLVLVNGVQALHDHAADMNFRQILPGLRRVLFEADGFRGAFPLLFLAVPGFLVLFKRRPADAASLLLAMAASIAFVAPYTWFRMAFVYPAAMLALAPAACALPPYRAPAAAPTAFGRVRWGRVLPLAAALVVGISGSVRHLLPPAGLYFYRHIQEAKVTVEKIPCDYFNNQVERWECGFLDHHNDLLMTGRMLAPMTFGGKPDRLVLYHPYTGGTQRRVTFEQLPLTSKMKLRFGLADGTHPQPVTFVMEIDGEKVFSEQLTQVGVIATREIDTSRYQGRKANVSFYTLQKDPNYCFFSFDGGPE